MRRTAGKMPTLPETEMHARRRAMLLRTVCNRDNCLGSFRQLVAESGREHNRRGFAPLGDVIGNRVKRKCRGSLTCRNCDMPRRSTHRVIDALFCRATHEVIDRD